MAIDALQDIRSRVLPMFQAAALQYQNRVPNGYPVVIDEPRTGTVGFEIDPAHGVYFVQGADGLSVRLYRRNPRTDTRATAGRQKYGGMPFSDTRPLETPVSDQQLRNLIAELMSYYNTQPGLLFITDD